MTKLFFAAGVAALAIAAPVAAERGGKGDEKKGQAAKAERGGKASAKSDRRGPQRVAMQERGKGREANVERRQQRAVKLDRKDRDVRIAGRRDVARVRDLNGNWFVPGRGGPIVNGCPPGLMDKGCMPPGQAKKLVGQVIPANYRQRVLPRGLHDFYRDNDDVYYRYGDGYVYRVDRRTNLISSLLPLLGAGLMPGQMFRSAYSNYQVPNQYRAFYRDTPDYYYRFSNGYVYEIDRNTGMIESLIPLMAGGYGVGQMLPAGYSAYNVPYQYRGYYPDGGDYHYRYAPGAIYQVDPSTSLVTSVASLLTGGMSVGQQLPLGYSAYNVPMAYRANYYDTPGAMYRYNDGHIYQVDPTTRLITAVIDAIV
ncbi:MAG TPA: hypothetical protein VMN38_01505 [Sphingomicrobium sp.]|nr:hypothetical protein [Sphingomicrobium sp.]